MRRVSLLLALSLLSLGALTACTPAVSLPQVGIPGPGAPGPEPEPTVTTSDASVVVLYYVNCRSCTVTFTTQTGMANHELTGGREFRAVFNTNRPGQALVLQVIPDQDERVNRARIRVGNATLAEARQGLPGDPVNLSAVVR